MKFRLTYFYVDEDGKPDPSFEYFDTIQEAEDSIISKMRYYDYTQEPELHIVERVFNLNFDFIKKSVAKIRAADEEARAKSQREYQARLDENRENKDKREYERLKAKYEK